MHNRYSFRPARTLIYASIAQEKAWGCEYPLGDPWGGPAFGEFNKGGFFSSGYWSGGGIFNSVTEFFSDPVGYTGERLAEFDKTVLQPVGKTLEGVGKAIANDPITFVASVAAVATGNAWMVPIIQGVSTAAKGGDVTDVVKSVAISAAATWVGGQIGEYVTSGMEAGTAIVNGKEVVQYSLMGQSIEKATATVIGNVVGYSSSGALGAAAMGKNGDQILTTALASGAGAALPLVLGNIPGYNDLVKGTVEGIAPDVSRAIANGIAGTAGSIVGAAITGKDIGTAAAAGIITAGINGLVSTKNLVTDLFKQGGQAIGVDNLSTQTQAIIANTMASVFSTALNGGKAGNILQQSMLAIGTQALQGYITDGIKQGSAYVSQYFNDAKNIEATYDDTFDSYVRNLDMRNDVADEINDIVNTQGDLADQYEAADNALDAYLIKSQGYQQQYDQTYAAYTWYVGEANKLVSTLNTKGTSVNNLAGKVNGAAKIVNDAVANQKIYIDAYNAKYPEFERKLNTYNTAITQDPVVATDRVLGQESDNVYYFPPGTQVAYGANGQYSYKTVGQEGYIRFNNSTFGDPIQGTYKYGYAITYGGYTGAELEALRTEVTNMASDLNIWAEASNLWAGKANTALGNYNTVNGEYQTALTDYNNTKKEYDNWTGRATSTLDTVNSIANDLNTVNTNINTTIGTMNDINKQVTDLNSKYTDLNGQLKVYDGELATTEKTLTTLKDQYTNTIIKLDEVATPLTQQINELTSKVTNDLVAELDPNFNAEQYKQINGLGNAIDAATHWLAVGKDAGLYTNTTAAEAAKNQAAYNLVSQIAKTRGYAGAFELSKEDLSKVFNEVLDHYGNDVFAMEAATPETFAAETNVPTANRVTAYDTSKLAENTKDKMTYGGWNAPTDLKLPAGVKIASPQEYAEGKSKLIQLADGNVAYVVSDGSQTTKVFDRKTGELTDVPVGAQTEKGPDGEWTFTIDEGGTGLHVTVYGLGYDNAPGALEAVDPMEQDPLEALYTFGSMPNGAFEGWRGAGDYVVDGAKAILDWAQKEAENGKDNTVLTIASKVIGGFGEQFQSFAGLAAWGGSKPENTDLYKLGQSLLDLSDASTPAEFEKRYAQFEAQYKDVQGLQKGLAFAKGVFDYPTEFLMGMVVPEIAQEIIPMIIGGPIGKLAGAGISASAAASSKLLGWVKSWSGVIGSHVIDSAESAGAGFNETYAEAKQLAVKAHPEWSAQQVEEYAIQQGLIVGTVGGVLTAVSAGFGGASLAKSILGPKASKEAVEGLTGWLVSIANKATDTGKIVIKEGLSESIVEEIPTQLVKDLLFLPIDPNRDIAGNLSLAGAQAFMTAGATTGSISAAHQATTGFAQLALNSNKAFMDAISGTNGNATQLNNILNQWLPTTTSQGADLRNTIVPAIFEQHPDWALQYATAEDYARTVATLGVTDPVALTELVDKRFDTAVTTSDELATDLYNKGLTDVTINDVKTVLGTGTQTPTQVNTAAADYVNANMVSVAEVQAAAKQEGYEYTQEKMDELVGRGVEAEVIQKFIQEIDPLAVTKAEATQYFLDLGYDKARAQDIAQFVKSAPETEVQAAVAAWVDPRQVTRQEAIEFYGPYKPTEEEINRYIVQGPEVAQDAIRKQVEEYVDPRYVDPTEVLALAQQRGLTVPMAAADIARLTGQYAESELAGKFEKELPVIAANATYEATKKAEQTLADKIAANESAGMARDQALQLAIKDTIAELGTTRTELLNKIDITSQQFQNEINIAKTDINKQLVTVEQGLRSEIQNVSAILGKPTSQVTAADVDMVRTMLAGETDINLAYDTNNDGKIDINDQINLQTQLDIQTNPNIKQQIDPLTGLTINVDVTTGKAVDTWLPSAGTQWAATGIYEELERQKMQQGIAAAAQAKATKETQQKNQFTQMMQMVLGAPDAAGRKVTVDTPDPSKINYIYDWSSIFATPQQAGLMPSPYGAINTYGQPMQQAAGLGSLQTGFGGQAANQPAYGSPYKMAVGGFAEGGMINNDVTVGGNGDINDLLNILKGNG